MGACMLAAARGDRAGRRLRRGLLPVQRGDGLVLPVPRGRLGGRLLPRRRVRARARRLAQRAPLPREPPRSPPLPLEAPRTEGGRARAAPAARLAAAARSRVPRASAAASYRDGAAWLASGDVAELVASQTVIILYLKLAFATAVVLAPGWLLARTLGVRSVSATLAWSLVAIFGALAVTFALGSTLTLTLVLLAVVVAGRRRRADPARVATSGVGARPGMGALLGRGGRRCCSGSLRRRSRATDCSTSPAHGSFSSLDALSLDRVSRVRGRQPASRLRLPALARLHRADREGRRRGSRARRRPPPVDPRAARRRRRVRGGLGALPPDVGGGRRRPARRSR